MNISQYVFAISIFIFNFLCLICLVKYKCFLKNCQFFVLLKGIGESQVCQGDQVGQISKETFCQTRYPKYPCLGSFGSLAWKSWNLHYKMETSYIFVCEADLEVLMLFMCPWVSLLRSSFFFQMTQMTQMTRMT